MLHLYLPSSHIPFTCMDLGKAVILSLQAPTQIQPQGTVSKEPHSLLGAFIQPPPSYTHTQHGITVHPYSLCKRWQVRG